MPDFMLAHVSDLHLGPIPPLLLSEWNVKRGLGMLNWHRKRKRLHSPDAWARMLADLKAQHPDHIALTGDLINVGLPAEHAAAARWLADLGSPDEVTVVPGNHDIYTRVSTEDGVGRWRPYMTGDDGKSGPVDGFPFVRQRGELTIVGLNSAEPTPPFVAAGRVGDRQLQLAGDILRAAGREGHFRCVMVHHPPLPGQAPPRRGLKDAPRFAAMLREAGAEMVLHGHNHVDMRTLQVTDAGPALVFGIGSGSMAAGGHEPPARYALHRIRRTNAGWQVDTVLRVLMPDNTVAAENPVTTDLPREA